MPLTINVGLSRKASQDYQSRGLSINVTAELDQALLAKPDELQQQVADLYAQAEAALDRQAFGHQPAVPPARPNRANRNGHSNGNGHNGAANNNGSHHSRRNGGGATESQQRAIHAIAQRAGVNADDDAQELFNASVAGLTIKQASELIDHLKALPTHTNGRH